VWLRPSASPLASVCSPHPLAAAFPSHPRRGMTTEAPSWTKVINHITPAIVAMRVNLVRHYDGNSASYSYATGFVVDAARGLILSNRHVVTTGRRLHAALRTHSIWCFV
jgi:S1-C subfamily serine protease